MHIERYSDYEPGIHIDNYYWTYNMRPNLDEIKLEFEDYIRENERAEVTWSEDMIRFQNVINN